MTGRSLIGSCLAAIHADDEIPTRRSVVVTGRLMKREEIRGVAFALPSDPPGPLLTLTFVPAARRNWPSVTTISP